MSEVRKHSTEMIHPKGVQIRNLIARKNSWFLESPQPAVQTFFQSVSSMELTIETKLKLNDGNLIPQLGLGVWQISPAKT